MMAKALKKSICISVYIHANKAFTGMVKAKKKVLVC